MLTGKLSADHRDAAEISALLDIRLKAMAEEHGWDNAFARPAKAPLGDVVVSFTRTQDTHVLPIKRARQYLWWLEIGNRGSVAKFAKEFKR